VLKKLSFALFNHLFNYVHLWLYLRLICLGSFSLIIFFLLSKVFADFDEVTLGCGKQSLVSWNFGK